MKDNRRCCTAANKHVEILTVQHGDQSCRVALKGCGPEITLGALFRAPLVDIVDSSEPSTDCKPLDKLQQRQFKARLGKRPIPATSGGRIQTFQNFLN